MNMEKRVMYTIKDSHKYVHATNIQDIELFIELKNNNSKKHIKVDKKHGLLDEVQLLRHFQYAKSDSNFQDFLCNSSRSYNCLFFQKVEHQNKI